MNTENMNPDACGELYPNGYLTLVDQIAENLLDSCESGTPDQNEIELYFEGLQNDVLDSIQRKLKP